MTEPINDIWKDPEVRVALKEGRPATDIAVLRCPECGKFGYYNEGSSFYCRFCRKGWRVLSEDEEAVSGVPYMRIFEFTSLADTVTVPTDGYDNVTL